LKTRESIEEMSQLGEKLAEYLENAEDTLVETAWAPEVAHILESAYLKSRIISAFLASKKDSEDTRVLLAGNVLDELGENIYMLQSGNDDTVRWIGQGDSGARALRAAPLRVGPRLMEALEESETNMIATSATISVGRSFDIPVRNLALDESDRKYVAKDVGTPFDYPKQAILYIPTPGKFPAPTGTERFEHTEAMLEELVRIVKAAGGRTLALSTTTSGARRMAERLRDEVDTPVLSQWDATPGVISQRFAEEETSTLCATMGMWHGLNVPGRSLSAVVIDKIPFPPMNDPLLKARQKDVDDRGGNGFMDVYVAQASAMLAQGVGRLIRNTQDRGMVAILDTRIMSARYGRTILGSLPGMWLTHDGAMATTSLKRLIDADQSA
jgi:ATP-dependent DNA helicase DinG